MFNVKKYGFVLPRNSHLESFVLIAISLSALFLRFYKLGEWSFWGDEVFTLGGEADGFTQSITGILIRATTSVLGRDEWSARLVPAIIGGLSIPILYFPIRRQFGARVALVSAALLAVSPWHIYWSQNARFYALLLLFYGLALVTFYIGIEENDRRFLLASLVFLALAAIERLLALWFVPVVLVYLILLKVLPYEKPAGFRSLNLVLYFAPGAAVSLAFSGPYLRALPQWLSAFGRVNNNPFWLSAGVAYYVGIPVILTGLAGGTYLLARKNRAALLFGLAALLPLALLLVLSLFHYTANRYVFVSLVGWILLAGLAIEEMFQQLKEGSQIFAAGALILMLVSSLGEDVLYFNYQNGNRENWRDAYAFIRDRRLPGDAVVTSRPEVGNYYLGNRIMGFQRLGPEFLTQNERIWFIEDMTVQGSFPEKLNWIHQNAQLVANYDVQANARLFKMRIYLYEIPSSEPE